MNKAETAEATPLSAGDARTEEAMMDEKHICKQCAGQGFILNVDSISKKWRAVDCKNCSGSGMILTQEQFAARRKILNMLGRGGTNDKKTVWQNRKQTNWTD